MIAPKSGGASAQRIPEGSIVSSQDMVTSRMRAARILGARQAAPVASSTKLDAAWSRGIEVMQDANSHGACGFPRREVIILLCFIMLYWTRLSLLTYLPLPILYMRP